MILRVSERNRTRFLRLTHVFDNCVYGMFVGEPSEARTVKRPKKFTLQQLDLLIANPGSTWGQFDLPAALRDAPTADSIPGETLEYRWKVIKPLIESFLEPDNLSRINFSRLIAEYSKKKKISATTLKRWVLRFYYFGGIKNALLSLPPGSKPNEEQQADKLPTRRRGRQSCQISEYGRNDFVASKCDIETIIKVYERFCKKGNSTVAYAYEKYLANEFKRDHPSEYADYINGKRSEPITLRQFRYYATEARMRDEKVQSEKAESRSKSRGKLQAASPGDITEADATGGRIFLVERNHPEKSIDKPWIYIAIDRWSRFVLGVYVSLKPPSYDELRYLLLVCMTSREARFHAINANVSDKDWPRGRLSSVMTFDRGSDFLSESTKQAAADELRIELTYLPPGCPDGKAIVERVIGVLKRRMASRNLKGSYKDRPHDLETKRAEKKAEVVAAYTLAEIYRILIDEVIQHNHRPHPLLRSRKILTQENVEPTPEQAYLWGLEHLGGAHNPPLTDADYKLLLMASSEGYIGDGVCRFLNRQYKPKNSPAKFLAAKSTSKFNKIKIRYDRTFPEIICIPNRHGEWAEFEMTDESKEALRGLTLDEEEALVAPNRLLWAKADTAARRERVQNLSTKSTRASARRGSTASEQASSKEARERETKDIKQRLTDDPSRRSSAEVANRHRAKEVAWETRYAEEERKLLASIRAQRKKK